MYASRFYYESNHESHITIFDTHMYTKIYTQCNVYDKETEHKIRDRVREKDIENYRTYQCDLSEYISMDLLWLE